MGLDAEIAAARKEISTDGYDMSVGELVNLYKDGELRIAPAYQRLFRWDITRKTRLVESILLGLPLPPIFVFQLEEGIWELIDGLQRISTVMEFVGVLKDAAGNPVPPLRLEGTQFLPNLADKFWEDSAEGASDGIGTTQQIQFKRARMRVEILKKESDVQAKYELFQRLQHSDDHVQSPATKESEQAVADLMLEAQQQVEKAKQDELTASKAESATYGGPANGASTTAAQRGEDETKRAGGQSDGTAPSPKDDSQELLQKVPPKIKLTGFFGEKPRSIRNSQSPASHESPTSSGESR